MQKKSYDVEFKKNIVKLHESGKSVSDLSREYGLSRTNIYSWIRLYGSIITSDGNLTSNDEILKLKKEMKQLQLENEILKKAMAIFTKQ